MPVPESRESPPRTPRVSRIPRRLSIRRVRPLLLPAALVAVAVLTGGVPGVILGFVAVLLAVDRWLDHLVGSAGWGPAAADRTFLRLDRERRRAALARRVRHRPPDDAGLAYLAEDEGWAAVAPRRRLGLETIPIASIVGTVDRHKAAAFDRDFRPPSWSRGRWTLMYRAARDGVSLPPISVYRVGDLHFLRDGHHRVSVARALGGGALEADVVELGPRTAPIAAPAPRPAGAAPGRTP
jgi:hypothetical protein